MGAGRIGYNRGYNRGPGNWLKFCRSHCSRDPRNFCRNSLTGALTQLRKGVLKQGTLLLILQRASHATRLMTAGTEVLVSPYQVDLGTMQVLSQEHLLFY